MTLLRTPGDVVARTVAGLGAVAARDVRVLAVRDGASLVVGLTTLPDGRRVVAKARTGPFGPDGARAARVLGALASAAAAAPDAGRTLAVPTVLLHQASSGLLVTDVAPGRPLDVLVRAGHLGALRRAGAALAELHATPVLVGQRVGLRACLDDLVRPHPFTLAAGLPDLAGQVFALLRGVLDAAPAASPARLVHRDVHLRQMHAEDGPGEPRTWLLDWDLACQGDPALDVGNLVASLRNHLPAEAAHAAVDALLEGYAPGDRTAALERVHVYEAFTYLRLACKRFRLQGEQARPQVARLLREGARRLEGTVPAGV